MQRRPRRWPSRPRCPASVPTPARAPRQSPARRRARRYAAVPGPKLSGSTAAPSGITMRPIGTLIQKIHCQATPSAIAPPSTGPLMRASPVTPLEIPSALPRSCGGNARAPERHRKRHHERRPGALDGARCDQPRRRFRTSAHATDAATNSASPATNMRRRPKRSPSAAPVSSSTAKLRL